MISRQRRWQLKRKGNNGCIKCPLPAVTSQFCEYHADKRVKYSSNFAKKPTRKVKQKEYDRVHKAKENYGIFWESQVLILKINDEAKRIRNVKSASL